MYEQTLIALRVSSAFLKTRNSYDVHKLMNFEHGNHYKEGTFHVIINYSSLPKMGFVMLGPLTLVQRLLRSLFLVCLVVV